MGALSQGRSGSGDPSGMGVRSIKRVSAAQCPAPLLPACGGLWCLAMATARSQKSTPDPLLVSDQNPQVAFVDVGVRLVIDNYAAVRIIVGAINQLIQHLADAAPHLAQAEVRVLTGGRLAADVETAAPDPGASGGTSTRIISRAPQGIEPHAIARGDLVCPRHPIHSIY